MKQQAVTGHCRTLTNLACWSKPRLPRPSQIWLFLFGITGSALEVGWKRGSASSGVISSFYFHSWFVVILTGSKTEWRSAVLGRRWSTRSVKPVYPRLGYNRLKVGKVWSIWCPLIIKPENLWYFENECCRWLMLRGLRNYRDKSHCCIVVQDRVSLGYLVFLLEGPVYVFQAVATRSIFLLVVELILCYLWTSMPRCGW